MVTSSCRGHVDDSATERFLLPHRWHGTGYRRNWNCCDRQTRCFVIWKHFCLILFTGTRIRIHCVMRPRCSSRGRNTSASVTVTVTVHCRYKSLSCGWTCSLWAIYVFLEDSMKVWVNGGNDICSRTHGIPLNNANYRRLRRWRSFKVTTFRSNKQLVCDFMCVNISNLRPVLDRMRDAADSAYLLNFRCQHGRRCLWRSRSAVNP